MPDNPTTLPYPDIRLLVFCKAPVAGQVKTRLAPRLGAKNAAHCHEALALHTLQRCTRQALCPIELWCAPDTGHPFFRHCQERFPLSLHEQQGKDLGERMAHALATTLRAHRAAILIGTDCPLLDSTRLRQACEILQGPMDAVLTPTTDGGYALIGLRRFDATLFHEPEWGGPEVFRTSIQRLQQLQWRWHAQDPLWDIDTPADLERLRTLKTEPHRNQHLKDLLRTIGKLC